MTTTDSLDPRIATAIRGLARAIGNTPLVSLRFRFRGRDRIIHAKLESVNLTGSIKDRMALHILRRAWEQGALRAGDRIVEATSGNTGIAFAAVGRALGHPVTIYMPDWLSRERVDLMRSLGAELVMVSREQGGFLGAIRRAEERAAGDPHAFLPRQFSNEANPEAHALTTGPELVRQLERAGLAPDAFVAGVGTGGTVMGVGRYLRSRRPGVRVHPLEPAESPTLSTGCKVGTHRIQGISDEFIPQIVRLDELDAVIRVHDGDAVLMAQAMASRLGLGVGISSGANFLGALIAQEQLGPDAVVVTVFCDDNKKYLSTDLLHDEPVRVEYLTPHVELLGVGVLSRVCEFCDAADPLPLVAPPSSRRA